MGAVMRSSCQAEKWTIGTILAFAKFNPKKLIQYRPNNDAFQTANVWICHNQPSYHTLGVSIPSPPTQLPVFDSALE